ncbi:nitroreductase family protein [Paenibacillus algorifonticola]|uniref:nitroreductase family protein n=1 Tax=Paenibacillus algorifonticola TaxID=684063 RepID=UPI0006190CD8
MVNAFDLQRGVSHLSSSESSFSTVIRERRSVRKYDPTFKMTQEEIHDIIADAVLAPSGSNLQPWRFLVITDQETKQKLLPVAFNQEQVVTSSAVIAVMADLEFYKQAERIYEKSIEAGYMTREAADKLRTNMTGFYASAPAERLLSSVLVDGGLVSMQLMLAARAKGFDTVPMAGYDVAKFRELMNVPENYTNVMLIALGKASEAGHPTTRLDVNDVTYWNQF